MYIDKVAPFWTAEDKEKLEALEAEHSELRKQAKYIIDEESGISIAEPEWNERLEDVFDKIISLEEEVDERYYKSLKTRKAVLDDVQEVVNAIEKEDFLRHLAGRRNILAEIINANQETYNEGRKIFIEELKKRTAENYEGCHSFMLSVLVRQVEAWSRLYPEDGLDKINSIIDSAVSQWYEKPVPDYLPMAHGKGTDALAFMNSKNAVTDPITQTALISKLGVELTIQKIEKMEATLGVSTNKLFSYATVIFTQQNDFRNLGEKDPNRVITIPLKEYASLLGYDVIEHQKGTEEEQKKEKRRAKVQLDNARKAIKKDLDLLHASTLTWEETIKGKSKDFLRVSLFTQTGIRNGEIVIALSPELAGYLASRNLITQYPTKLLGISGRNPNAYYIGRKLALHDSIDNNQIKGTHNRIGIPALLAVTDLPSYEEVQKTDRGHWERRIKEPLEQALDTLTNEGVLTTWEYVHAKGIPLTDEEAGNLTEYRTYEKLLLHFELADAVDHTDRIKESRAKRKKKS